MTDFGPLTVYRYWNGQPTYVEGLPCTGAVGSQFGPRAPIHIPGVGTTGDFHSGVDIVLALGTPLYAAAPGKVVYNGGHAGREDGSGLGHSVILSHPDGSGSVFAHLDGPDADVGDEIDRGEVIGYVGLTGFTTGPHLHYMRITASGMSRAQAFYDRNQYCWFTRDEFIDPFAIGNVAETVDDPDLFIDAFLVGHEPSLTARAYLELIIGYARQGVPSPALVTMLDELAVRIPDPAGNAAALRYLQQIRSYAEQSVPSPALVSMLTHLGTMFSNLS